MFLSTTYILKIDYLHHLQLHTQYTASPHNHSITLMDIIVSKAGYCSTCQRQIGCTDLAYYYIRAIQWVPQQRVDNKNHTPSKTVLPIAWQVAQRWSGQKNVSSSNTSSTDSSLQTHFTWYSWPQDFAEQLTAFSESTTLHTKHFFLPASNTCKQACRYFVKLNKKMQKREISFSFCASCSHYGFLRDDSIRWRETNLCGRLTRSTLTSLRQCQLTRRTFQFHTTIDRRWPGIQCCRSTSMEQTTGSCHLGQNSDSILSQT